MSANKALYHSIKKAIEARGLTYEDLGKEVGYCCATIKRFMAALKSGKNGSRFVRDAIVSHFDGKIIDSNKEVKDGKTVF